MTIIITPVVSLCQLQTTALRVCSPIRPWSSHSCLWPRRQLKSSTGDSPDYPFKSELSALDNRYLSSSPLPVEAGARLRCLALVVYKPRFRTQSWNTTPVFGSGWHRACRSWTRVFILGHRDMLEHNLAVYSIILAFDNSVQILDQNKRCFCEITVKTIKSVTNVVMFCLLPVHGVTQEYSVTSPG